uniref:Uncharacterized protein n=1 Tax=Populus trichocarpa TaxID=3694 RepID=A0A3N7FIX8_POPTR
MRIKSFTLYHATKQSQNCKSYPAQRHLPITQLWLLMVRDQRKPWLFKMRIANPSRPSLSLSLCKQKPCLLLTSFSSKRTLTLCFRKGCLGSDIMAFTKISKST